MRVLFCTTGGFGHLQPLRPLARALRQRGHQVAWVTAPDALPWLAGEGFELFAAGPGFEASRRQFQAEHAGAARLSGERLSAFTFPRLFGAVLAPAMLPGVEQAACGWRPDLVVHEPAALAAPLVCQRLGLAQVVHGYGLRPPDACLDEAMGLFAPQWLARGLEPPAPAGPRRLLRLDIVPRLLEPAATAAADDAFRYNPYRPGDKAEPALPADLQRALLGPAARGPRVYLSFGTVFNRSPALQLAARAAAQIGATVVVTVGADGDPQRFADLGPKVHAQRFVAQGALLPHCDAVVSHGGAGTLLAAASHGLPQLVLPQAADHFRNARALTAVNAGCTVDPDRQTVAAVASALAAMLAAPAFAAGAQALARAMAAMPDADAAAAHLACWQRQAPPALG